MVIASWNGNDISKWPEVKFTEVVGWWRFFSTYTPRESTDLSSQVGPAGSRCGIRWREEVSWIRVIDPTQYEGTDCWWVFLSQVWSAQFLEVNVKSIEIADMMFDCIIFRFNSNIYISYLAIGNATSCMSMFCFGLKSPISSLNLAWLHHRAMSFHSTQLTCQWWWTPTRLYCICKDDEWSTTWHLSTFEHQKIVKSHWITLKIKDNPQKLFDSQLDHPPKQDQFI